MTEAEKPDHINSANIKISPKYGLEKGAPETDCEIPSARRIGQRPRLCLRNGNDGFAPINADKTAYTIDGLGGLPSYPGRWIHVKMADDLAEGKNTARVRMDATFFISIEKRYDSFNPYPCFQFALPIIGVSRRSFMLAHLDPWEVFKRLQSQQSSTL
ncbi:hypothetical protein DPSP01_010854 [Paraphaeosphaeria sporulosa]|uniref:Uncharacterized protein n=1 Tax=Paraphaeosphaeria sporulosa TaxID=1460663 RepID=A0A177C148_9PLEO|nr:uncharacterized protein CC84DRAFT_1179454 [Paraphaeosphaeria sporulosa]OAG01363.1 hypothetical protein CC84DRAFT_1179454 [Paraphaeosphaeria sporulosa]